MSVEWNPFKNKLFKEFWFWLLLLLFVFVLEFLFFVLFVSLLLLLLESVTVILAKIFFVILNCFLITFVTIREILPDGERPNDISTLLLSGNHGKVSKIVRFGEPSNPKDFQRVIK